MPDLPDHRSELHGAQRRHQPAGLRDCGQLAHWHRGPRHRNERTRLAGAGPLTLSAGRDIVAASAAAIHVSNSQLLILTAARDLTLFRVETLGAVNLTATTGNITLNNDIGPHIVNNTGLPDFNPADLGVASLNLSAGGSITMQGARAEGNVTIMAGGNLSAAKAITSVGGTVTFSIGGTTVLNQGVPIGNQNQLAFPFFVLPAVPPGPQTAAAYRAGIRWQQRSGTAGVC